jgi:proto-oncogene tyrosine-protein kinase ROS
LNKKNNHTISSIDLLSAEIKTPHAPALLADSLNATSLSLEWEIPLRIIELAQGNLPTPKSYLVQWRFEEIVGDWKFCRNQSMGENSTVRVDNLRPYTKYRVSLTGRVV